MPEQSSAIEVSYPPKALMRVVNPVVGFLLRTPLGVGLKEFMILNFHGRKTGRTFSITVSAHLIEGDLYALLTAAWKQNFRDGLPVEVRYAGKTASMTGQLITDPATVADLAHRTAVSYGAKKVKRTMGLTFRGSVIPSLEEFTEASGRLGLTALRLTAA